MRTCADCVHFICTLTGKCIEGKWHKICPVVNYEVSECNVAKSECFSPWRTGKLKNIQ
ncbi:MAG: hypothetical protein VB052_02730 [Anaerorhabdus sp.]|jgi:hypothetical protein|nr:hypothetical protein [Anaerorhabdus sp.]MEA4874292.1 hypothetical protein [Anaerorhabdus sp.]